MRLQGVLVEEERTPADGAPIRWLLLTTLAADTPEQCRRIVEYYTRRWRIEDWHRILKSGCKVEELAHRSATRLARAAAVNLVVAWRIFLMTLLGRDQCRWEKETLPDQSTRSPAPWIAARRRKSGA